MNIQRLVSHCWQILTPEILMTACIKYHKSALRGSPELSSIFLESPPLDATADGKGVDQKYITPHLSRFERESSGWMFIL